MTEPAKNNSPTRQLAGWLLAFFLVILGAKLWIICLYGSPLPVWDQWPEAQHFFKPWVDGRLTWSDWFAPHNEHRIFFTRLLDLAVIRLNGRWDTLLQMTLNAGLHAGYACLLAVCLWNFLGQKNIGQICLLLLPFFALPFAAENTIRGFDSQQYFLSIGSLVVILALGFAPSGTWRWWFGLVAAVMNLFTMESGLLAPLAVAGLVILRALKEKKWARANLVTLGASLTVFALGLELSVKVARHQQFQAKSFADFAATFARNLTWPFLDQPLLIVVVCLPLVLLVIFYSREKFTGRPAAEFLLCFGLWGVLQSAALAYGRANYGDAQGSRYLDALCVVSLASVFSVVLLAEEFPPRAIPVWAAKLLPYAFAGLIFFGIGQSSRQTVNFFLVSVKVDALLEEESVRAFMATDDVRCLQDKLIPLPDPQQTIALLRDKKLSVIMPAICQPPSARNSADGGWLSAAARRLQRHAMVVLLAGLVLFIGLAGIEMVGAHNFGNIICLIAGLTAVVCAWPERNLDVARMDHDLHRTLGFHLMAHGDSLQAALQFMAVLQLEADHPNLANARDSAQTLALAQQNVLRTSAEGDSNLVAFLSEKLKTFHTPAPAVRSN